MDPEFIRSFLALSKTKEATARKNSKDAWARGDTEDWTFHLGEAEAHADWMRHFQAYLGLPPVGYNVWVTGGSGWARVAWFDVEVNARKWTAEVSSQAWFTAEGKPVEMRFIILPGNSLPPGVLHGD